MTAETDEPAWPALTSAGGPTLQLRPGRLSTVGIAAEHQCAFWDTIR